MIEHDLIAQIVKAVLEIEATKLARKSWEEVKEVKDCILPGKPLGSILERREGLPRSHNHRRKPDPNPGRFRAYDSLNSRPIFSLN
jgi:hypothetical protein